MSNTFAALSLYQPLDQLVMEYCLKSQKDIKELRLIQRLVGVGGSESFFVVLALLAVSLVVASHC